MANISNELLNMLTGFLITNIKNKALHGITYVMLLNNNINDKISIERYKKIRKRATDEGFSSSEVFRVYELPNGYLFDMDMSVVKYATTLIAKSVNTEGVNNLDVNNLIGNRPETRRQKDMQRLANKCIKEASNKSYSFEIALFSRNTAPKVSISALDRKNRPIILQYDAFAVRHWDLEDVNGNYLLRRGLRISKIEPCEILPSKTGIRFIIHLERIIFE